MLPAGIFDKIVIQASDLPAMSVIASKVVKMVSDDKSSAKDLGVLIARDQALTTKVLKLANSALYSYTRNITSIRDAVVILGFKTLKSLVVTVSFHQIYGDKVVLSLEESLMWKHSIAVAIASRELCKELGLGEPDEAFTAGLIHDIGKVILSKYLSSIFSKTFQMVYNENISFIQAEKEIMGFTHNDLGAAVLRKWQFPELLVRVVEEHNDLEKAKIGEKLSLLVFAGDSLALAAGYGVGKSSESDLYTSELTSALNLRPGQIDAVRKRLDHIMEEEDTFLKI